MLSFLFKDDKSLLFTMKKIDIWNLHSLKLSTSFLSGNLHVCAKGIPGKHD